MIGELNIYGVYVPWLLVLGTVTLFIVKVVSGALARLGFYRLVWHPALFDLALYVVLLFGVWSVFPQIYKFLMV